MNEIATVYCCWLQNSSWVSSSILVVMIHNTLDPRIHNSNKSTSSAYSFFLNTTHIRPTLHKKHVSAVKLHNCCLSLKTGMKWKLLLYLYLLHMIYLLLYYVIRRCHSVPNCDTRDTYRAFSTNTHTSFWDEPEAIASSFLIDYYILIDIAINDRAMHEWTLHSRSNYEKGWWNGSKIQL